MLVDYFLWSNGVKETNKKSKKIKTSNLFPAQMIAHISLYTDIIILDWLLQSALNCHMVLLSIFLTKGLLKKSYIKAKLLFFFQQLPFNI